MMRWLLTGVVMMWLLAGCQDARRPTVRQVAAEPDSQPADTAATTDRPPRMPPRDGFHGMLHGKTSPETLGPEVHLGTMGLTAPEGWIRKQPRSGFILAEFSLPRAEDDTQDARLTVTAVGGSVQANFDRWRRQFGGKPEQESQGELEVAGVKMALVDFSGTYNDQHMGLESPEQRPGYRMRGAIFRIGVPQFIIKCYGPQTTMAEHADEFDAFLRSLKPNPPRPARPEAARAASGQAEADQPDAPPAEPAEVESPSPEPTQPESTEPQGTQPKSTAPMD